MNPALIPWVDIYTSLPDGPDQRRRNKERLAVLEDQTPERHERFKRAAEAWRAERDTRRKTHIRVPSVEGQLGYPPDLVEQYRRNAR